MFLFTFTKLRKQIFAASLAVFIGIPLLFLLLIFLRIPIFSSAIFGVVFIGIVFYFFIPAALAWAIFGYGHFFAGGIGVAPNGVGGIVITLIFYSVAAFLLSLVGNFKKDVERVPWKEAISKRYLKKLFLIIAGIVALTFLLSGLERLLLFPKQVKDVQERLKDEQIPVRIESAIQQGVENLPVQMLQFQKEPISVTEEEYERMLSSYKVEFAEGATASVGPAALLLSSFWSDTGESYSRPLVRIKLVLLPIPNINLNESFAQIRVDKVLNANGENLQDTTVSDDGKLIRGANMFEPSESPAPHFIAHKAVYLAKSVKSKNEINRVEGALTIKLPVELKSFTLEPSSISAQGSTDYFTFSVNEDFNGKYVQMGLTDFTSASFTIRYRGIDGNLIFPIAYADNGEPIRIYRTATAPESAEIPWGELRYSYSGKIQTLKAFVASRIIERSYPFMLVKDTAPIVGTSLDKKSCNELENDIHKKIEDANYCATDADCAIAQFGVCPFGCYNFVNKNADTSAIKNLLGAYTSRCKACIYKCTSPPAPEEIYCRNNKCVDGRLNNAQVNTTTGDKQLEVIRIKAVLHPVRRSGGALDTNRTDEAIRALFEQTQKIWSQAGIVFDVELNETVINYAEVLMNMGNYPFFNDTVAKDNNGALHVYYVRDMAGANGWIVGSRHVAVADITTVDDFRATAHEIGHVFGLGHTEDNMESLMASGRNGQKLSDDEIRRVRGRAKIFSNE